MGFTEEIHRGNLDQMCLNIINKYPFLTVYSWITELLGRDGVAVGNTSVVPEQKSLSPSLSLSLLLCPSLFLPLSLPTPLSLSPSLSLTHTGVYISPLEIHNYTALTQRSVMCSYRQKYPSAIKGEGVEN